MNIYLLISVSNFGEIIFVNKDCPRRFFINCPFDYFGGNTTTLTPRHTHKRVKVKNEFMGMFS